MLAEPQILPGIEITAEPIGIVNLSDLPTELLNAVPSGTVVEIAPLHTLPSVLPEETSP